MKKLLTKRNIITCIAIIAAFFIGGTIGSSVTKDDFIKRGIVLNSNKNTQPATTNKIEKPKEEGTKELKAGETYNIKDRKGEWELTFEGLRVTAERNEYSEITAKTVFFLDYSYKNIDCKEDLYVSPDCFKLIDEEGNMLDSYAISDSTRNSKELPKGAKSKASEAYAITTDSKKVTVIFYGYNNKPLGQAEIQL